MKKKNRLLTNKDFKSVLDKRNNVSCGEFVVYAKKNELNYARIGISVSSKLGNSVIRHKIKRQIVAMINKIFDLNSNFDVVIIARNKFLSNNYFENEEILKKMLFKLNNREEK